MAKEKSKEMEVMNSAMPLRNTSFIVWFGIKDKKPKNRIAGQSYLAIELA